MSTAAGLSQVIEFAVSVEHLGANFYRGLAEKFRNAGEISLIFSAFALDEESHEQQFRELFVQIPQHAEETESDENPLLLWSISPAEMVSKQSKIVNQTDQIKTRTDAINIALSLEKDTLSFYSELQKHIGASKVLETIIDTEKKHVLELTQSLSTDV